jgi:hypothetical protein
MFDPLIVSSYVDGADGPIVFFLAPNNLPPRNPTASASPLHPFRSPLPSYNPSDRLSRRSIKSQEPHQARWIVSQVPQTVGGERPEDVCNFARSERDGLDVVGKGKRDDPRGG